jgi:hypothetical protein
MFILVLDIGGSGIKIGLYNTYNKAIIYIKKLLCSVDNYELMKKHHYTLEKKTIQYIKKRFDTNSIKYIGISTAGNIESNNTITRWGNRYNIINKLITLGFNVFALNDSEAHMYYCLNRYQHECKINRYQHKRKIKKKYFPAICVTFGSGIGFSVVDENGLIVKTTNKQLFLDNIRLTENNDNNSDNVHSSLNQLAFNRVVNNNEFTSYNKCIEKFLEMMASLFSVRTIFIGDGIAASEAFHKNVYPTIKNIKFIKKNKINIIRIVTTSALSGMGFYINKSIDDM